MKNKLQISTKTSLTQRLLYASLGVGAIVILVALGFLYLNLGRSEKALAASYRYASKDNQKGVWNDESTWNKNESWLGPRPVLGTYFTANVVGFVTYNPSYVGERFNIGNGSILDITDTLVINGDAVFSQSGPINVKKDGVLVIFGNLTVSGGVNFTNEGRVVITENLITPDGVKINNNATGNNNFYLYGQRITPSYDVGIDNINSKNESQLQTMDRPLYDFVRNGGVSLLPIVLDYFKAGVSSSNANLIEWGTFSEQDNDFFTLERSSDGKNFEAIATIDGAGNSNEKRAYQFLDQNPAPGNNFYRLKQTDFDGQFEHFKIVMVHNQGELYAAPQPFGLGQYSIYPNPFREELNFRFEATHDGLHDIVIYNPRGEAVFNETILFSKGLNTHNLPDLTALQPGIYLVELRSDEKTYKPQRMVKL